MKNTYDEKRDLLARRALYLMYKTGEGRMLVRGYDGRDVTFKFIRR